MAEVFKAKSFGVEGFEKILVIKRILPDLAERKSFVDMFVHEAKLAVRLSHANIVQVFDLGRVDPPSPSEPPAYFMAMEYVAGLDLASVLGAARRGERPLPIGMAVFVGAEVAKGLDHAHRRRDDHNQPLGIVHRDISPQNILLSWEGEVKVTDFGIAKARDNLDDRADEGQGRELKGKHAYMSPEQARAERVDGRSDLFSLGTVLYEAIAGVNPFRAPTSFETLRRVQAGEYPPLELLRQDVPAPLADIVKRALAKRPDDRYPDAGRMYEELLGFLYQSSDRFGASDLCDFLSGFRDPTSGEVAEPTPSPNDVFARVRERTPVEVPSSASIRLDGAATPVPTPSRPPLVHRREATSLVISLRAPPGASTDEPRARAADLIARYGGHVLDPSSPFEVAALFGLRDADARDTEYAVRCGLLLLRTLATPDLSVGMGVHVGRLLASPDDEPVRDELMTSLLGTSQALARLAEGRVAISASAARLVRGLFTLDAPPPGAPSSQPALLVGDARAAHDTYGRFVGRREELQRIGKLLAGASRRQLRVVTIAGAPGVGKTRLLHEVDRRLRKGEFNVGVYVASCAPRDRDVPLSGLSSMLQALTGVQEGDTPLRVLEALPSLRALGLLEEEVSAVLAHLGAEIDAPSGTHALRNAFVKMAMSLSEDRVHVFAWDDAHSLDEASLELLTIAAKRLATTRCALLFAGRPGFEAGLSRLPLQDHLSLDELPHDDAVKLLSSRIGVQTLPDELVEFCLRRAGGHPLFLEELVKDLRDSGAVSVEGGAVTAIRLEGDMSLPRPLRSIMSGRIARLDAPLQAALQVAAVAGEPVEREAVSAMLGADSGSVAALLEQLEGRELLHRTGPSTYVFATPMLRDVVADGIPLESRRDLHARAAAALEPALALRSDEGADRVAAHYLEAGDRERAVQLYMRAARRRIATRQYEAARVDVTHALELLDGGNYPVAQMVDGLRLLSSVVTRTRVAPGVEDLVLRLIPRIDGAATGEERALARIEAASVLAAVSRFEPALAYLSEAREGAASAATLQRARLVEGELQIRRGDFQSALRIAEEASERGLDAGNERRTYMLLAQAHGSVGDRDRALSFVDRAAAHAPDDIAFAAERAKLRGLIYYFSRDYAEALVASTEAAELAKSANLLFDYAISLHNVADTALHLRDHARAYTALSQSLAACEQCGAERLASQNRMFLGYLDAAKGIPGGEAVLRSGIEHAEAQGYEWDAVNGRYLLGLLLEQMGLRSSASAELTACREKAIALRNSRVAEDCAAALLRCRPSLRGA